MSHFELIDKLDQLRGDQSVGWESIAFLLSVDQLGVEIVGLR